MLADALRQSTIVTNTSKITWQLHLNAIFTFLRKFPLSLHIDYFKKEEINHYLRYRTKHGYIHNKVQ